MRHLTVICRNAIPSYSRRTVSTYGLFISSKPSSGAEPKAKNRMVMKLAPSITRTPLRSAGTW